MKVNQENVNTNSHSSMSDNEERFGMQVPSALDAHQDCAFDGAISALLPIVDAAHLIHGPSGCMNNFWRNYGTFSPDSNLHNIRFTTDMEESDIIFGGAKKLQKAIVQLARRYQPSAVFVYSTCVSALIGDDIYGVCRDANEETGIPIIPVDSPGFAGRKNLGIRLAGETLVEHVIGTAEPEVTTPYDINIISEYNIAGAVSNLLPLLEKLGVRVLANITGNAHYQEICYAHRAKFNVIISSKTLLKMAKQMQDKFGISYLEASLYGVEELNRCLRNIAAEFGDTELQERTENLIAEEVNTLEPKLGFYRLKLQDKRVIIEINSFCSWSMISAAKSFGMAVIPISNKKLHNEDKNRLKQWFDRDEMVSANENWEGIFQIINEYQVDLLIANSQLQSLALQAKIPFLNINPELNHSYTGYAGILAAAQELYATIYNPVWQQVRKPAPWEEIETNS